MKKKYAIKDIAKRSGVSIGTVDRVIHDRGKVSEKTLEKVNRALKELDYSPNPIARSLKNNRINQIGILIPDPEKDLYWLPCKKGIIELMNEFKGFDVEMDIRYFDPSEPRSFIRKGNKLLDQDIEAMVFVPLFERESEQLFKRLEEKKILSATFNSPSRKRVDQHVGQNLFLSGRVAAKLIHDMLPAASKIAIVHVDEAFYNAVHMQEKENGFRNFINDTQSSREVLTLTLKTEEIDNGIKAILKKHPKLDAFFVTTSKAFEVVKALHRYRKSAKIVGYDLLPRNIDCLAKGQIEFLLHQAPKAQAELSLRNVIEKLLFGKEIPREHLLPIQIVNSENVKSYL